MTRTGADGVERIAFIGYINEAVHDAESKTTELTIRAPESLILESFDAPFPPPLAEQIAQPQVFDFWWKQLGYVFNLPDPRTFPPLPDVLTDEERLILDRYLHVAGKLAASGLLNALEEGFNINAPAGARGPEEILQNFSRTDLQVGFAGLLRQCDSPKEQATFHRVRNILNLKSPATYDDQRDIRGAHLRAWRDAARALRAKSLNQLIREKLVAEEGLRAFEYAEEHSPEKLLNIYNYGDLIHWDSEKREILAEFERDPFTESDRRLAYLDAASGVAHLYIGFAELARTAVGRLLTPSS